MEAGVCFNSIPSNVSFLNGPLMGGKPLQVKQRVKRQRMVEEEEAEEESPEDVQGHTKRDADQLSAIEQSMKVLDRTLKKKVDQQYRDNKKRLQETYGDDIPQPVKKKLKKHGQEICGMKYLLNPKSFTQSVENIFHFSFLIKKATASINVREKALVQDGMHGKPGVVVKYMDGGKKHPTPRQTIVSLTMKDWRDLCEAYDVSEGDLPHRTGSRHAKSSGLSQSLSQQSS